MPEMKGRSSGRNLTPLGCGDVLFARTAGACAAPRTPRARRPLGRAGGFTLIEIMVVVVILGILAALVLPNVMGNVDKAQVAKVKQDLQAFDTALSLYRLDNFKYPSTDQGLQALVQQPNDPTVRNWKPGGYLKGGVRKDPWGNDYVYVYPGAHGEYDLYTLGADGQEGGEGINADIGNWMND